MKFYITAIALSDAPHVHIAEVSLHNINPHGNPAKGEVKTKNHVLNLIAQGHDIYTVRWSYISDKWLEGAKVEYEIKDGVKYLRTDPNATASDNLRNLPGLNTWM